MEGYSFRDPSIKQTLIISNNLWKEVSVNRSFMKLELYRFWRIEQRRFEAFDFPAALFIERGAAVVGYQAILILVIVLLSLFFKA